MTRRFDERKLVVATHNHGKLQEIENLFGSRPFELVSGAEMRLIEPEETESTFLGNARIKAHSAARASGYPSLADDSGIEVDALNGEPGVYTADWAETPSGRNFVQAMVRTWNALEKASAPEPRTARFRCTLVLAWPDGHDEHFEGRIEGRCIWPMRGDRGHGYDPMFQPNGYEITLGEMDRWEKNTISHRGSAFKKLLAACFD